MQMNQCRRSKSAVPWSKKQDKIKPKYPMQRTIFQAVTKLLILLTNNECVSANAVLLKQINHRFRSFVWTIALCNRIPIPIPMPGCLPASGKYSEKICHFKELKPCGGNYFPLSPISFLERAGTVYRERMSIVYGSVLFTWAETLERCRRLASALGSLHIKPGDVVSVVAPNVPATYEMHFGVPMAGAVLNTLNIRHDPHTMSVILRHSGAKVVFVDYEFLEVVQAALGILSHETKEIPLLILIDEMETGVPFKGTHSDLKYEGLLKSGDPNFETCWPDDEWNAITLNYTSGTTSSPKGVVYNHRGAYLNTLSVILMWEMKIRPVYLWTAPMFHCNGWCFPWGIAAQGGTNICLRSVNAKDIFDAIAEHQVTHLCAAPTVLSIIANAPPDVKRPLPQAVQVLTGGSPPPPPLLSTMEELGFNITHIYGLTETYGPIFSCAWKPEWDSLPSEKRAKLKSRQGVPHLGVSEVDVKIPCTMESVPHDSTTVGEVMVKGNIAMSGYLKAAEATAEAFEGGWFHTGDLGVVHPDGYVELKDRSKDIIISGGENVSSIEVETVLYSHPKVLEAAVVGRPDDYWGETPCAFVKLKDSNEESNQVSPESIIDFCRAHLPHYMAPRTVIFGDLPKTSTGKFQKFLLREKAKALGTIFPRNYIKQYSCAMKSRLKNARQAKDIDRATIAFFD
eukprot:Gb_00510 [translate_table: standard]